MVSRNGRFPLCYAGLDHGRKVEMDFHQLYIKNIIYHISDMEYNHNRNIQFIFLYIFPFLLFYYKKIYSIIEGLWISIVEMGRNVN